MSEAVANQFDDVPVQASDDEVIKRLIVDELYWDPRVDASKVLVEVTEGVAILTGRVPTYADRYAAEADARMVTGVRVLENHICVDRNLEIPDA